MRVFDKLHHTTDVTRGIKALRFSKIVLEMLFFDPCYRIKRKMTMPPLLESDLVT